MPTGAYDRSKAKRRGKPGRPRKVGATDNVEAGQFVEFRTALDGMLDRLIEAATAKARSEGHAAALKQVAEAEDRRLKAIQG